MTERRRDWSRMREAAHDAAAVIDAACLADAEAPELVAAVLDDEALLPVAITEWQRPGAGFEAPAMPYSLASLRDRLRIRSPSRHQERSPTMWPIRHLLATLSAHSPSIWDPYTYLL